MLSGSCIHPHGSPSYGPHTMDCNWPDAAPDPVTTENRNSDSGFAYNSNESPTALLPGLDDGKWDFGNLGV